MTTQNLNPKEDLKQISDLNIRATYSIPDGDIIILLLNMGGPKTNKDVKSFQQRLFCDARLIRFPLSFLLQKIFAWVLISFRLKATEKRYQLIGGGSPIYESTRNQVQSLKNELFRRGRNIDVDFSFNYSSPLPDETIAEVKRLNKKIIFPLSLYPHYSKATTGSNLHYLKQASQKIYPEVQFLEAPAYYLHDGYIQAFVDRVYETIKSDESLDDFYLIFSAHGLPIYFLTEGDPYPFQIAQTVAKVLGKLNRSKEWIISYQSSVGPMKWMRPSTDDVLTALAERSIKKIIVIPIAFVGDHIETSCEIDIEYRHFAQELGIRDFRMSKALECHPQFISALADSVEEILKPEEAAACHL